MKPQHTLSDRVRVLTLARFFPVVAVLCLCAIIAALTLINYRVSTQHTEILKDFEASLHDNIEAVDQQVKALASNDLIINSLIDYSNRDSYLPVFFRSLTPININQEAARYSIAFLDFEGSIITGKNVEIFEGVEKSFAWKESALTNGTSFQSIDKRGVMIVHPVIYGANAEGAIALYISNVASLISYSANDVSLFVVSGEQTLFSSNTAKQVKALNLIKGDLSGVLSVRHTDMFTLYANQAYQSAYSDAIWIVALIACAVGLVIFALLLAVRLSSYTASDIINRLREQVAFLSQSPDSFVDVQAQGDEPKEIGDLRVTFNSLMNALLTTTFAKDQVEGIIESLDEMLVVFDTDNNQIMSNNSFDTFYKNSRVSQTKDASVIDLFPMNFVIPEELSSPTVIATKLTGQANDTIISWRRTLYKDASDRLLGIVLAGVDITKSQAMQHELSIKNKAIDEAQTPIIITDALTRGFPTIYVNHAFEKQTGYSAKEILGNSCRILQGEDTAPSDIDAIRKALVTSSPTTVNILNYRKDGKPFYNRLALTPLVNEEGITTHIIGFQQDITDEQKTKRYLQAAKLEAEESARLKSEFLASMSHEIRTPMNGILGMLGLLIGSTLNKEQAQHAQIAKSSADALLVLINDILDFSKIEAGKLTLETVEFDIVNLLSEIATTMSAVSEDKNIELILDTSMIHTRLIIGDPGRTRQVLNNLIGNAIKFTNIGHVFIHAQHASINNAEAIQISISDTGVGIPKERTDTIFDSFSQADASTTRKFGGTGLGLTICKQLAELMGGDISVASVIDKGSTFKLSFACETITRDHTSEPDFQGLNVLIADPSVCYLSAVKNQLATWNTCTETVNSEDQLLNKLSVKSFDLLLLSPSIIAAKLEDIVATIKASSNNKGLKVCFVENIEQIQGKQNRLAGDTYAPKPLTANSLQDLINTLFKSNELLQTQDQTAHQNSVDTPEHASYIKDLRALLVEDNPINQILAMTLLEAEGLDVVLANHGKEALEQLQSDNDFGLIFMDCQMPEMDGYQATNHIREGRCGDHYKDIPIIAMTANAIAGDREKCLSAGMSDYISKPIDTALLKERIAFWAKSLI